MAVVSDVFERIFVETELETAVMEQLRLWMPTYIQEIELQLGRTRGQIPPPRYYTTRNEFEGFPQDSMPMCIVVSSGFAAPPTKEGDGTYSAWYQVGVGFAAWAKDADASGFMAKLYSAAGRKILLDRQSVGGVAQKVEYEDHSNDDLASDDESVVRASYDVFRIFVWNILTENLGPISPIPNPDTQPGSDWPTANIVRIDNINVLP